MARRQTIAFPGGSSDFELSNSRVAGFTNELRDDYGVEIVDSPEAVAERCDLLFIESVDMAEPTAICSSERYGTQGQPSLTSPSQLHWWCRRWSLGVIGWCAADELLVLAIRMRAALADESAHKFHRD